MYLTTYIKRAIIVRQNKNKTCLQMNTINMALYLLPYCWGCLSMPFFSSSNSSQAAFLSSSVRFSSGLFSRRESCS